MNFMNLVNLTIETLLILSICYIAGAIGIHIALKCLTKNKFEKSFKWLLLMYISMLLTEVCAFGLKLTVVMSFIGFITLHIVH